MTDEREELIEQTAEAMCAADDYIYGLLTAGEKAHYRTLAVAAIDTIVPHIARGVKKAMWGATNEVMALPND